MRKKNIITGVLLFFIAFLFPPCYNALEVFAGNASMEWRPLWSVQGTAFAIKSTVWFTILGSIAFGTFIFAAFAKNDKDNSSKSGKDDLQDSASEKI